MYVYLIQIIIQIQKSALFITKNEAENEIKKIRIICSYDLKTFMKNIVITGGKS